MLQKDEYAEDRNRKGSDQQEQGPARTMMHFERRPEDFRNAEAKIAADKARLVAERVSYNNAHIASPIAGTVYLLPVKQYDFVQMGTDLLHVANVDKLRLARWECARNN